ncbi:YdiU family protein [Nocardioides sp. CFH 31398]|uniref:protein adenylyltransferase SelO n=1 Tax=Nocardioides sp. CFH 31398 TaxID=2919579 RepID=UPI001F057ECC|nr:YdiU family protein [Nocardioides sp. CFH 31398]MCH1866991.1 YdiU family protein [Nocardioides sp. CFH 31398]
MTGTVTQDAPALEHVYADLLPELAKPWQAAPAPDPSLVVLNEPLAAELGLDADWLRSPDGLAFLVGAQVPDGATPVAMAYAGHQFGGFSPLLGDGRALLLGELRDAGGRLRDVHLKGSGRTPFARGGDGLAVLAPMLREYVVSEAMHALGVPTTRSLAVVTTGRDVARDGGAFPGALLVRVASSHLRVGTFQLARTTDDADLLRRLADHAIARHHPAAADAGPDGAPYVALFEAVRDAQARLVAQWMGVGFVHGVMNTDNVTISGETIDYGPCAFLDAEDPATVFSSIDHGGRYAFGNQPGVTAWNLARLAEGLLPLVDADTDRAVETATASLQGFAPSYAAAWTDELRRKLGLAGVEAATDEVVAPLGERLVEIMQATPVDHTGFWRDLAAAARGDAGPARDRVLDLEGFDAWVEQWRALGPDADAMDRVNPVHVPRNHLVEEALDAATAGDLDPLHALLAAVTQPYDETGVDERYRRPAPEGFGAYTTYCGT